MGTVPQFESTLSDEDLVVRVRLGETELYGILIHRHNRRLRGVLGRILRNHDDVEDILQQAHLRALQHLGQFEGRSSFLTWLSRVAINEAYMHLRRRRAPERPELTVGINDGWEAQLVSEVRDPEQYTLQQELRGVLLRAVASLPEHYRLVFGIRYIGDVSTADTASRLGITEQCVKSRLLRARRILRKRISGGLWTEERPRLGALPAAKIPCG